MSFAFISCVLPRAAFPVHVSVRQLLLLGLLAAATLARAEPKFMGYFYEDAKPVFSLADADGTNARWVELGGKFDGYLLDAFDRGSGILTLSREGRRVEISLNVARVKDARVEQLALLRSLSGLARAQELARTGDAKLGELLKRRQQALDSPDQSRKNKFALEYLEKRVEDVTAERMAELEKAAPPAPPDKVSGR